MLLRTCCRTILSIVLLNLVSLQLQAQDDTASKNETFSIRKGKILGGFSINGISASRDDYNHEFERAFSGLRLTMDGMYFANDRIGFGPILGYERTYQDYEDPTGFFNPDDRWSRKFLYGAKAGWYIPVKKLFESNSLDNTYLFINGGVSWLWNRSRREGYGTTNEDNRFGYQLSGGLLVPVGKKISLEWKFGWESRRKHYHFQVLKDGEVILDFNEVKWLKELSLGLGLKVKL